MTNTTYGRENVLDIVQQAEQDYLTEKTDISEHVEFSLKETVDTIEAYVNSKHTSGLVDSMGREKPFFNIVTAAENIWYRATDIDRRNIRIKADHMKDVLSAFIATLKLREWMRGNKKDTDNFGMFLNKWGRTLARYGSAIPKFIEVDGDLKVTDTPWNRLILDNVSYNNTPLIEIREYTPGQLLKHKGYDKAVVKELLDELTTRENPDGDQKDNKADFVRVYHVHGELPNALMLDDTTQAVDAEWDSYSLQFHAVSYVEVENGGKKTRKDFSLQKGKLSKEQYVETHLIPEDNRVIGRGSVENLFDAQWMTNHSAKTIKDQLDITSKIIFQTADGNYLNLNVLSAIEQGDILIHEQNSELTQVNNTGHDITSLQSFKEQWKELAKEITSTPDVLSGKTLPSGTAWRQAGIIREESHSLYEIMIENKGLYIEKMMREHILPFIRKKLKNKDEIVATLESADINFIDPIYIKSATERTNKRAVIDSLMEGQLPVDVSQEETELEVEDSLRQLGATRGFRPDEIDQKTWDEIFDGFVWDVEVEVTSENTEKEATMTTLTTVLQTIATNPNILSDPAMKLLFNKILEETGRISPIELQSLPTPPQQQAPDLEPLQPEK